MDKYEVVRQVSGISYLQRYLCADIIFRERVRSTYTHTPTKDAYYIPLLAY